MGRPQFRHFPVKSFQTGSRYPLAKVLRAWKNGWRQRGKGPARSHKMRTNPARANGMIMLAARLAASLKGGDAASSTATTAARAAMGPWLRYRIPGSFRSSGRICSGVAGGRGSKVS